MPITAPTPDPGNAPEGILEPPEPVVDAAPVVDVPLTPEVTPEPEPMAPGVYSGVWPNLVLTATVDENGATVKVPKVKVPVVVDAPPPIDLAAIPEATPETPVTP